jgi:hypothetical protein
MWLRESFGCIGCGLKILFQPSRHRWALVYLACIARFRSRTKLEAAAAKVKTHPTLKIPRCRTFRNSAIVFSQPKHSSTRFLFL